MYEDPIVEEVRKTRERLAEKHNFDVNAIFEDLRKRQSTLGKRLVRRKKEETAEQAVARAQRSPSRWDSTDR